MTLLIISLAPVFLLLAYIYFRDRYEKEPIGLLIRGFIAGAVILFPVAWIEGQLVGIAPDLNPIGTAVYQGFVVAEPQKSCSSHCTLPVVLAHNGISMSASTGSFYAVSVSLGFAAIENILYVYEGSYKVGLMRAVTAVPAHMLFGIMMGYYLGLARFIPSRKSFYILLAVLAPWAFHGTYDFLILSGRPLLLLGFIPFLIIMWRVGLKRLRQHELTSLFRKTPPPPPGPETNE
jgi:RsiW-degrading membrane proteinase PrsW (M82 family)